MPISKVNRRLAAILAADVVGYSRLIGEDESGTLNTLRAHREGLIEPKITEHHGRIVKLMGDGLLAEFPSAVEAVQCAVEIQHTIGERNADVAEEKRIIYRVGINIGDIVVEGEDIYGDGVNVAARVESLADPNGIFISRNVFDQVKEKLNLTFEHVGEKEVKNIAEPVTVYRVVLDDQAASLVTPVVHTADKPRRFWRTVAVTIFGVLAIVIGGLLFWQPWAPQEEPTSVERIAFPLPDKPSIAVLPFTNMSGDAAQEYFADGLTEDLTTNLSLYRELFVIARNSSFAYKDRGIEAKQVGRDLGVAYIVEGSVRREGKQVRVNSQLIDTQTGNHVWAEKFDREFTDIFEIQDEITQAISGRIAPEINRDQVERSYTKRTEDLDAWDLYLQAAAAEA